jgi:hypothetical protein
LRSHPKDENLQCFFFKQHIIYKSTTKGINYKDIQTRKKKNRNNMFHTQHQNRAEKTKRKTGSKTPNRTEQTPSKTEKKPRQKNQNREFTMLHIPFTPRFHNPCK